MHAPNKIYQGYKKRNVLCQKLKIRIANVLLARRAKIFAHPLSN